MRRLSILLAALCAIFVMAGTAAATRQHLRAEAHATGAQEVPAVATDARGRATFKLNKDGTMLAFKLNVSKLENARFAHIHLGANGSNGPVVAFLRADRVDGPVKGRYAEGELTAADLVGPLAGQPLSALLKEIEAGNTYINVHTDAHPAGEIRGQIEQRNQ